MATWFAQNSSVNIDSVNQWNSAANGSGSWLTWASLGSGDILVANGKTSITCNVSFTCAEITTAATGGTAGGGFLLPAGITITAGVTAGSTLCLNRTASGATSYIIGTINGSSVSAINAVENNSASTIEVTGNVNGRLYDSATGGGGIANNSSGAVIVTGNVVGGKGNASWAIQNVAAGSVTVTGNVTGGTSSAWNSSYGITNSGTGPVTVTGNVSGGSGSANSGISNTSTGTVSITGDVTAANGYGILNTSTATITVTGNATASGTHNAIHSPLTGLMLITGNIVASSTGMAGVVAGKPLIHASNTLTHTYRVNNAGAVGVARSLYTGGTNLGQPTAANVRSGTAFGAASEYTGTLAVPSPTLVAIGVSTDNTVGSYNPSVNASDIRSAVGLAAANLDTQLSGIQSDTNDIQTRLPAALESGRIAAVLDSPTQTQIDNIETSLTTLGSESTTVERSVSDTNAITFSWPVSGATITGTASLNNGTYGAVAGAIAFLRTETGRHYYTLAYNAADRPSAEGQVRYKFVDGTYTGYVVLRTVTTVLADTAHGGAAATLVLSTIDIQPASADTPGVLIRGTGYAAGIDVKGGEYADGIKARSGDTSGYGICSNGVQGGARFWSTNGYGVRVSSDNSNAFSIYGGTYAFQINSVNNAIDVYSSTGNAVYLQSAQNDAVVIYPGADDIGVHIWGGQTSGDAVALSSNGTGSVFYPVDLSGLNDLSAADVNAEVVDVLSVDTFAELSAPPAATSSLKDKITWLFMYARNKVTQTALERKLYRDDTTTVAGTSGTSDNGTTFTKGEDS